MSPANDRDAAPVRLSPVALLTEKDWQAQVVDLARMLGWDHIYHTYRSKRSASGWPDLALCRDRLILLELKTETGKLSDAQHDWLNRLLDAGAEAYVARPRDLELLGYVLQVRHRPSGHALELSTGRELGRLVVDSAA